MKTSQAIPLPRVAAMHDAAKEQPFDRALAVLDVVTLAARPLSVTDIAGECCLPVPTVHRLVAQLKKRGLLKSVLGSKKIIVGFGLVRLGMAAVEASLRSDRPHQILAAFANQIGENCELVLRSEDEVIYVDTARALRSTGLHIEQGRHAPVYATSSGKLFLAEMNDADFEWWLGHATLLPLGPRTIVSPPALRAAIRKVRKEGWATNNEELTAGTVGCAVPIRDFDGNLLAGLGLSAPSARVAYDTLQRFRAPMQAAAVAIAAALSTEDQLS
jgi:IclR family transcriptional regulator, acetate operon repressor